MKFSTVAFTALFAISATAVPVAVASPNALAVPAPQADAVAVAAPQPYANAAAAAQAEALATLNTEGLDISSLGSIFGGFADITGLFGKLTGLLKDSDLPMEIIKTIVAVVLAFIDGIVTAMNSSSDANIITKSIQGVLDNALAGLDSVLANELEDVVEKSAKVLIPIAKETLKAIVSSIVPLITQLATSNYLGAAVTVFQAAVPVFKAIIGSL